MSNLLFCTTDAHGFREDCLDYSFNYQNSGFLDLKPDYYGLQSWNEFYPTFSDYDLIWLHLNPRVMHPPWYDYAELIRQVAPDTKIIISHEYLEKYYSEDIPYFLIKCFSYVDFIQMNSKTAYSLFSPIIGREKSLYTNLSVPIRIPETGWGEPLSYEEKEGVVLIEHSVFTPLVKSFEIIRDSGLKAILISSNPSHNKSWWGSYVDSYNIDAEVYGRLLVPAFYNKINSARVALDYGYTGISRFSYECAKHNTPVIGHNRLEFRNKLYPKLTALNDKSALTKLKRVYNDEKYWKHLNSYADNIVNTYWSDEEVNKRVKRMLRRVGVKNEGETI